MTLKHTETGMKSTKTKKRKGPVRAKKVVCDGITFQSGLEKFMYVCLRQANIPHEYEGKTYTVFEGFDFPNDSFERQANGKGDLTNRGNKKILPIKYTPDFIGPGFIIECKGRANESFPIRWKMFKRYVKDNLPDVTLYKPQNQKECEKVIELILSNV